MLIQMKLLTDTVFGNGNSIPGGEDGGYGFVGRVGDSDFV